MSSTLIKVKGEYIGQKPKAPKKTKNKTKKDKEVKDG